MLARHPKEARKTLFKFCSYCKFPVLDRQVDAVIRSKRIKQTLLLRESIAQDEMEKSDVIVAHRKRTKEIIVCLRVICDETLQFCLGFVVFEL